MVYEYYNTNAAANSGANIQSYTITNGTSAGANTTAINGTYYPTGDYWWWQPYIYPWGYPLGYPWGHACGTRDHEFMQAQAPHNDLLFCRHCGETKPLRKRSTKK